jgi:hypothetical protein
MACHGCMGQKGYGFIRPTRPTFIPADFADRPLNYPYAKMLTMGKGEASKYYKPGVTTPYYKGQGIGYDLASKWAAAVDIPDYPLTQDEASTAALADAVATAPPEVTADVIVATGQTYYAEGYNKGKSGGMLLGAAAGALVLWLIMR